MNSKGAEWRKWDLHIHSPKTYGSTNRYNGLTISDFCADIVANKIAVIGLTNYFYIKPDEYNEVKKYLDGKCEVIPNFEFRASDKNKKGDAINFHVLFNPDITIERILATLARVELHNHSNKYLTESDIESVGRDSVSVDFEKLVQKLRTDFKEIDDFLIASPYYGYGGFNSDEKPRNSSSALKFDKNSHFIFGTSNHVDVFTKAREYSGVNNLSIESRLMAVIHCSDAHCREDINRDFTWIKAEPSFEGLKQVIFEPLLRSRIQADQPEMRKPGTVIESVHFGKNNSRFGQLPINFNGNLNVIIGGKSSGKSILLYNIARTLLPNSKVDELLKTVDPETNKLEFKYEFGDQIDFNVKLNSGVVQKLKKSEEETSILPHIKYIPQNYLSELAERKYKKSNELNKLVRELLLEDEVCAGNYKEFVAQVKRNDLHRETLINSFFELKEKNSQLVMELGNLGNPDAITVNISKFNNEIDALKIESGLTSDELKSYEELDEKLQNSKLESVKIDNDLERVRNFNSNTLAAFYEIRSKKEVMLNTLENNAVKNHFTVEYQFLENIIGHLETIEKVVFNAGEVKNDIFSEQREANAKLISDLLEKSRPYLSKIALQSKLKILQESLLVENKKQDAIRSKKEEIEKNKGAILEEYDKIFDLYKANYKEYERVINSFEDRVVKLMDENLSISGKVKFNVRRFKSKLGTISNGTSRSYRNMKLMDESFTTDTEFEIDEVIKELGSVFKSIVKGEYVLNRGTTEKEAIKVLLNDYFFDYWEVSSEGDTLYRMSSGKASFVILKLIVGLSNSTAPILIDQPEDNLDNRSITKDLVEYLRIKKSERQIILVTHNPNIVVNGDAENIIVANQQLVVEELDENNKFIFEYINGPLEHTYTSVSEENNVLKSMGIREHIADIVEGGKEAFMAREMKYRFS